MTYSKLQERKDRFEVGIPLHHGEGCQINTIFTLTWLFSVYVMADIYLNALAIFYPFRRSIIKIKFGLSGTLLRNLLNNK